MTRNLTQVGGSFIGTMEQFEFDSPDRRASTELYIFSQDDELLTILSPSTGLTEALYKESLNTLPDTPFTFTVDAEEEHSQHVREENQVVFRDKEGDLLLYVIKELDDSDGTDGATTTAVCEPAFMELKEHIVVDRRMDGDTADVAIDAALDGTRWTGSVEVELGNATQNFYYITSIDAIWKILEVWGGEFKAVVEFDETNKVNRRTIKILQRRGSDTGLRWEIGHNVEEIQRTVLSYPVTAMYGRGTSLRVEDEEGEHTGGYTRYIDFADEVWSEDDGDPVDKPEGQRWIGDPDALQKYGRQHNGELLHREDIFSDQNIEETDELLQATWDALQNAKEPEVNYELSVHLLEFLTGYEHEHVELGDTTQAVDRNFGRPIEIEARVISIEYDLLDIEGTATVEMGQFLTALDDDRLDRVIEDINDNRGRWEHPEIDDSNFPDIEPSMPTNLEAAGSYRSIQLYWDFNDETFIKHYELYASQAPDFVPSSENMIWRGYLNGYNHIVESDQVWYYYVRAINHHGRASEYSERAEGSTVRIIDEDILFGEDIAESLRDLSETAGILADSTIDFDKFSDQVKDADGERIKGDLISVDGTTYIAEGVIGNAAIKNLSASKIDTGTMLGDRIQADTLHGDRIIAGTFTADKMTTGTLQGIDIYGVTITGSEIYQSSGPRNLELRNGCLYSYSNGDLSLRLGQYTFDMYDGENNHIGGFGPAWDAQDPSRRGMAWTLENDFVNISMRHGGLLRPLFRSDTYNNVTTVNGPYNNQNDGAELRLYANRRPVSEGEFTSHDQPSIILDQSDSTNDIDIYYGGFDRRTNASVYFRHRSSSDTFSTKMRIAHDFVRIYDELRLGSSDHTVSIIPYSNSVQWRFNTNNYIRQQDDGQVSFYSSNTQRQVFRPDGGARFPGDNVTIEGDIRNSGHRTTSNSVNTHIYSNTGRIARATSARKYKTDIQIAEDIDYEKILDLNIKSWYDKEEVNGNVEENDEPTKFHGLIADDFDDVGLSEFVVYDDGEVENYSDRAWTLLIPNMRDMKAEIESLKREVEELKG
ncbi:phage tail spike protein [Salicibibacter kimchii]|nr:phage tail spike protein [Salicibibacter kimchii]